MHLGSPSFREGQDFVARQADGSAVSAWKAALAKGPDEGLSAALAERGDFAVGLQDLDRGAAFVAVDRFAIQTMCYRVQDGQLRFAQRADELADAATPIDLQAIFDYLFFHCIPSPRTIYQGVHRLPPGHCAQFQGGQVRVLPYWRAQFSEPGGPVSFESLKAEFRGLLKDAVARQLDGTRPACFLSGGTDSSTVAGMIREVSGQPAHTYSIGFQAEGYDEMAFARLAARHFGCEHHEYYVTPDDLVRSIAEVAGSYDQPFGNSSALPAYYCALKARGDGVTRLLAGDGGDELFGGNSRYAKQSVFGWYQRIPAALRRAVLEPVFGSATVARMPLLKKGRSYVEQATVPMPDRLQMYNLLLRLGPSTVLTPEYLARINVDGPAQHQRQVWEQADTESELNRTLAFDWRYTLAESDLPKVRGSTQLAGVSVGYPMLDQGLLDFSLRLPERYKLKGLRLRWFFKEALRGFLPDEILTKKKQGFGLPFGVWMTRHDALRRLAADSLGSLSTRGIVRPDFIRELLESRIHEHPGYFGEMVWILMMLEQWLQRHAPRLRVDD
ncbi:MAG: asparagine synthase [Ideonella sp.]|nr:asparagine synthase [Ideonella sp.]